MPLRKGQCPCLTQQGRFLTRRTRRTTKGARRPSAPAGRAAALKPRQTHPPIAVSLRASFVVLRVLRVKKTLLSSERILALPGSPRRDPAATRYRTCLGNDF